MGLGGIYGASYGAMGKQRSDSTSIIPGGGAMGEGYGVAGGLGGISGVEGNGGERPIEVYG